MIGLAMACVLFFLAVQYCGEAKEGAGTVNAFLTGNALEKKEAEEICDREAGREAPVRLCFWGETPQVMATCRETGNSRLVTLLTLEGNPQLIVPGAVSLAWQEKGCLVDTVTAQELFGTVQADGQLLGCGEEIYVVQGTFESAKKMVVRTVKDTDAAMLNAVSLELGKSKNAENDAEQFLLRYGLEGEIVSFHFLISVTENLLLLLPLILTGSFLIILFSGKKGIPFAGRFLHLLGAVAAAAFLVWLFKNRLSIPADMIPSRWADFSFWKVWWQNEKKNILRIFNTPLGEAQLSMVWNMQKSIVCSLTAAFAGLLFCRKT